MITPVKFQEKFTLITNYYIFWFEIQNIALGTAGFFGGGVIGAIFGGPIGAAVGATAGAGLGTIGAEVGEEAWANPQLGLTGGLGPFGQIVAAARVLSITIDKLQGE